MTGFREIMVDVETGGPVPLYPLLSIGACDVIEPARYRFYAELKPVSRLAALPRSVRVSWPEATAAQTLARLERDGLAPRTAIEQFAAWVETVAAGRRPIFLAHNALFDWQFINLAFHEHLGRNPFGIGGLDVPSFWTGRTNGDHLDSRFGKMPTELTAGLDGRRHNALNDALRQTEVLRRMRAGVGLAKAAIPSARHVDPLG